MLEEQLLAAIRRLGAREEDLFRVHRQHGSLYARARRQFGSWSAAVGAAGFDYPRILAAARQRSYENRRRGTPRRRPP